MDILAQIQADFVARLNSLAFFSDIEIIAMSAYPKGRASESGTPPESVEQLMSRIASSLGGLNEKGGKTGAAILVPLPSLMGQNPNVPGPQLQLMLTPQILINPIVNESSTGTNKELSEIALNVLQAGHHFQIENVAQLTAAEDAFSPGVDESKGYLVGVVAFQTRLQLAQPSSVKQPTITIAANVTLACATEGASIYYTADESLPWSGNTAATLYSAPFTAPAAGTVIRAAAYKTGMSGSNVAWKVVS